MAKNKWKNKKIKLYRLKLNIQKLYTAANVNDKCYNNNTILNNNTEDKA